ncbi:MFS transporter [Chromatiaceae bacterium AAb-1]|nr:MFS transporter [Chromatiaceae bacterium AAb-1]
MSRLHPTIVIFSGFFLLGNLIILWGLLLPDISASLNMDPAISGLFFMLMSVGTVTGAILGGKYVQKFDFLRLFGTLAFAETFLLLLVSHSYHWQLLLPLIIVVGLLYSVMFTIGHTLIARLYINRRAAMMGMMDFMFSLGTLAAPFWVVVLFWYLEDWRIPLRIIACGMLLLSGYTWWVAGKMTQPVAKSSNQQRSLSYLTVLKQPVFLLLLLSMIGYGAAEWGNGNWFVTYAIDGLNYPSEQARLILAWFTGGMVISRLGFALLLRWFSPAQLMVILASLALTGGLMLKLTDGLTLLALGNLALGLGVGGLFPLMLATAMDLDSDNGPVLSGLASIGNSLGFQLAGLLTGFWAQQSGILVAFWVIPVAAAWMLVMVWLFQYCLKRLAK